MKIEGKSATINNDIKGVFNFLTDFNNFEPLMPEQVTDWQSDKDSCSFVIQGMANLKLVFESKNPYNYIKLIPEGKVPFQFFMEINLAESGIDTIANVSIDADLNPMMAMMAKRPLENFVSIIAASINDAIGR